MADNPRYKTYHGLVSTRENEVVSLSCADFLCTLERNRMVVREMCSSTLGKSSNCIGC